MGWFRVSSGSLSSLWDSFSVRLLFSHANIGVTCQISWGCVLLSKIKEGIPTATGHCLLGNAWPDVQCTETASSLLPAFLLWWRGKRCLSMSFWSCWRIAATFGRRFGFVRQIRKQGHPARGERSDLQQHFGSTKSLLPQVSVKPRERSSCWWRPPEGDPAHLNPSA